MKNFTEFSKKEQKEIVKESGYSMTDWLENDELLIERDEFKDYAKELAEDVGAISKDNSWPSYCIDWDWACEELENDYTIINVGDEEYLFRAW